MKVKSVVFVIVLFVSFSHSSSAQAKHAFGWKGENFLLDSKPFIIRSGEMHYPRVPREYWRDRFKKAKAMGLNTITTYVFWNLHEPTPGKFDFTGNLDVAEFVREAGQEGLYVIVRPGPYICTEWDFGGFPSWLLKTPDMKVRSSDQRFLEAAARYMKEVGKLLAPLQINHGGNIIMTQVENEYGSFGKDHDYMRAVEKIIRDAGFDNQLYTADGSADYMLIGGTLPDIPSVINFGADDTIAGEFENFAKFRKEVPRMSGEFWIGWFDHWGEKRHTVAPEVPAKGVDWMLTNGISFSLYMFHGGTSFGFMAGANSSKEMPIEPDTSSYDYDSPLDEAGRPTKKFFALRDVIQKHFPGEKFPGLPAENPMIEIPNFELKETTGIEQLVKRPTKSKEPLTMESLDQSYGFVLYRKAIDKAVSGRLTFGEIRDYAVISQGGKVLGTLDRRLKQNSLDVKLEGGKPLDILVENMGRINFGGRLVDDRKGIIGEVKLDDSTLTDWEVYSLPMTDLNSLRFSRKQQNSPVFYRGSFELKSVGDSFMDTSSWEKGHVWINGHHLGRFWKIGPQQTLYVPASWLQKGRNDVIVLDVGRPAKTSLQGVKDQIFGNQ
jgi:beta-galactosidase